MADKRRDKRRETRDKIGREEVLDLAKEATSSIRNISYGEPQDDFACTSELWESYLARTMQVRGRLTVRPYDVPVMMVLLKISRLAQTPGDADHWVDMAGYAAIGAECAMMECCE
jgi:hypothetical protein